MRKHSVWRKFRRRLRAITCGEWFFLLIVLNIFTNIYQDYAEPDKTIGFELRLYCERRARDAFPELEDISIKQIQKAYPSPHPRSKEWIYIGEILNDNKSIGIVFCNWYNPKLEEWGVPLDDPPTVRVRKYPPQPLLEY